jgi:hypothetical protein
MSLGESEPLNRDRRRARDGLLPYRAVESESSDDQRFSDGGGAKGSAARRLLRVETLARRRNSGARRHWTSGVHGATEIGGGFGASLHS